MIVALLRVEPGDNLIRGDITIRLKYYLVLTFLINVVCAGEYGLTGFVMCCMR